MTAGSFLHLLSLIYSIQVWGSGTAAKSRLTPDVLFLGCQGWTKLTSASIGILCWHEFMSGVLTTPYTSWGSPREIP